MPKSKETKGFLRKAKGKEAWTVTVGEKGQIVIPKQAREMFDIHPGDSLLLLGDEKRGLAIPVKSVLTALMQNAFQESDLSGDDES